MTSVDRFQFIHWLILHNFCSLLHQNFNLTLENLNLYRSFIQLGVEVKNLVNFNSTEDYLQASSCMNLTNIDYYLSSELAQVLLFYWVDLCNIWLCEIINSLYLMWRDDTFWKQYEYADLMHCFYSGMKPVRLNHLFRQTGNFFLIIFLLRENCKGRISAAMKVQKLMDVCWHVLFGVHSKLIDGQFQAVDSSTITCWTQSWVLVALFKSVFNFIIKVVYWE